MNRFIIVAIACGSALTANAKDPVNPTWNGSRPDSHAPLGVMGDHTHSSGEIMLSYRYAFMPMNQNYNGSDSLTDAEVLRDFMVAPTSMDMEMHMMGLMYAPSDRLTLMFMAPYSLLSMEHLRRDGTRFTTESDGWGDLSLTGLINVLHGERTRAHLNLGVGFPTGETDAADFIPGPGETRLPYPMQPGSGAWSLRPGLTFAAQENRWSWGAQVLGTIYAGDNDEDYRPGDRIEASLWAAFAATDKLSAALRLKGSSWGDIEGSDPNLIVPAAAVPTADTTLRGGSLLELGIGFNYRFTNGRLSGTRLAIEALLPIHRDLDGPQLGSDWTFIAGLQYSF